MTSIEMLRDALASDLRDAQTEVYENFIDKLFYELHESMVAVAVLEERIKNIQSVHASTVDQLIERIDVLEAEASFVPEVEKVEFCLDQNFLYADWSQPFTDHGFVILNHHVIDVPRYPNWTLQPADKKVVVYYMPDEPWLNSLLDVRQGEMI